MGSTTKDGEVGGFGRRPRILLGVTGSVAAIKASELARALLEFAEVKVMVTKAAQHFVKDLEIPEEAGSLMTDEGEWSSWKEKGDLVLHISLRNWADLLLIAPLSANTLAKISQGLCDNLLTSVFRAWDFTKPVVVAPAMNTHMWENPFTERHMDILEDLGITCIAPIEKLLACGDQGMGAMAAPNDIAESCIEILNFLASEEGEDAEKNES